MDGARGGRGAAKPGSAAPVQRGRDWGFSKTLSIDDDEHSQQQQRSDDNILPTTWKHTDVSAETAATFTHGAPRTPADSARGALSQHEEVRSSSESEEAPVPVVDSVDMGFVGPTQLKHAHGAAASSANGPVRKAPQGGALQPVAKQRAQKMSVWEEAAAKGGASSRGNANPRGPPPCQRRDNS